MGRRKKLKKYARSVWRLDPLAPHSILQEDLRGWDAERGWRAQCKDTMDTGGYEKLGMNGVEKDCNQYDSNMTAESGRERSRFKSWQKQGDWLAEISAECGRSDGWSEVRVPLSQLT